MATGALLAVWLPWSVGCFGHFQEPPGTGDASPPSGGGATDAMDNSADSTAADVRDETGAIILPSSRPTAAVTTPATVQKREVILEYLLFDADGDLCEIIAEFSVDNGIQWRPARLGTGGDGRSNLSASPQGEVHHFVWDSRADGVARSGPQTVMFRISPRDTVQGDAAVTEPFTVDNAAWSAPTNVSKNAGTSGLNTTSRLVVDSRGHLHAVWPDSSSGTFDIYYAHYDELSWQAPTNLTRSAVYSCYAAVAAGPEDQVHVAWSEDDRGNDGNPDEIYHLSFDGVRWSMPHVVSAGGTSRMPDIAVDGLGRLHLVWYDDGYRGFGTWTLVYARSDDGGLSWTSPEPLAGAASLLAPLVVTDSLYRVHVAWIDNSLGRFQVLYLRAEEDEWLAPPVNVSQTTGSVLVTDVNNGRSHELVVGPADELHLIWNDNRSGRWQLRHATGAADTGQWSVPEVVLYRPRHDVFPSLAVDRGGTVHIVWSEADSSGTLGDIFYAHANESGGWTEPRNLSNSGAGSLSPEIVVAPDWTLHVLWDEGSEIYHTTNR
jgi:hypothetical protein